ncbi:MAG: prealbumin-like fold domain-containing protein [Thermomicrobiales bacterium]
MVRLLPSRGRLMILLTVTALAVLVLPVVSINVALNPPGIAFAKNKHGGGHGNGQAKAASVNKENDEGDDQGDDNGGGPNQNGKGDEGKGKKKGHEKQVAQAKLYLVAVACQFQDDANATTCLFVGGTENGTGDVTRISIPHDMACAKVTGGSFSTATDDDGGQGFTSPDGAQAVTLVISGQVRTSGTASYRVTTANGLFPASGPGLRCGEPTTKPTSTELSATSGAVRVIAYKCPAGTTEQTADWYAKCTQPAASVTFNVVQTGVSSDNGKTGTTDDKGNVSFTNLAPATYHLTEENGDWCHAESDSVNAQGDVIVRANERSTVWIFHCP